MMHAAVIMRKVANQPVPEDTRRDPGTYAPEHEAQSSKYE